VGPVPFRARRALSALSLGDADRLSHALADAPRRPALNLHIEERGGSSRRRRIRVRAILQSRLKTSLRNPACPLSKLCQAAPRSITRCRRRPGQDESKRNEKTARGPRRTTVIALRFDVGPTISSLRGF
jgi:hypothetical protein